MRTYPYSETLRTLKVLCAVAASLFLVSAGFSTESTKSYSIAPGQAADTLKVFAEQSGRSVMFSPEKVRGIETNEVKGDMTTDEAMDRLLSGTKLSAVPEKGTGGYAVRREATVEIAEKNGSS